MTQEEWPLTGHAQASPLRATAIPLTDAVPEAAVTLPPWLVTSPSRITPFMLVYRSASQRHTVMPYAEPRLAIGSFTA